MLYTIFDFFSRGPGANRRRRKKSKDMEDHLELFQQNKNFHQKQHQPNISIRGNGKIEQSPNKRFDRSGKSRSCFNLQKIDQRDKIHQPLTLDKMAHENIFRTPSILQDSSDLFSIPLSTLATARMKSANAIKLPRLLKSSVETRRPTSTISIQTQPTKIPFSDLNGSVRTRMNQSSASNVPVSRVKRSSSAGRINRITTSSSNINLSRVTFINTK
jgi:hypothetical protein